MRKRSFRIVLLGALAIAVAACSGAGDTSDTVGRDRSADEAAIHALLATNEAATNRRDAAGVAATFVPEGDIWIIGRSRISGLDEIRRNEEEFYSTPGFQGWHATIDAIRFISPNVALVESTDVTTLDTGETVYQTTWVTIRQNGDWRFAAVRVMSLEGQP